MERMGNGFAVAARFRKNAGAMRHRSPTREHVSVGGIHRCLDCGTWIDPEDADLRCVLCSERHATQQWLKEEAAWQDTLDYWNAFEEAEAAGALFPGDEADRAMRE